MRGERGKEKVGGRKGLFVVDKGGKAGGRFRS